MKDRSRHFIRLALAGQAFREADAMAEHLLSSPIQPGDALYHASVAGMVVSYCRPFMSASGLGPLSSYFRTFYGVEDSALLQKMHDDLSIARDKISAHIDIEYGHAEFVGRRYALHPGEVELILSRKDYVIRTNHTTMPLDAVARCRLLFDFQLKRISKAEAEFVISLAKETHGRLGSYVFRPNKSA
jgi:hypothetical protein